MGLLSRGYMAAKYILLSHPVLRPCGLELFVLTPDFTREDCGILSEIRIRTGRWHYAMRLV